MIRFSPSLGRRIFVVVMLLVAAFAASFVLFQRSREHTYKASMLNARLQAYNAMMAGTLDSADMRRTDAVEQFVARHPMAHLRVTLIGADGHVVYDNRVENYRLLGNHADRPEIAEARRYGHGDAVERMSGSLKHDYFYAATYLPGHNLFVRSALPFNADLAEALRADSHYLWLALLSVVLLAVVLWRFVGRVDKSVANLQRFAVRATSGDHLDCEELAAFPGDELGEIAERIVRLYQQLEATRGEQDRLKRELTQNMAHELKTPVASIQGYVETLLAHPGMADSQRQQFLERAMAQSKRLGALVTDISTLNRLDAAPSSVSLRPVALAAAVEAVRAESALALSRHDMTMRVQIAPDVAVMADGDLLYSVLRNLTDNAIAYAGRGTQVAVEARQQSAQVAIAFADNGQGVAEAQLPRLFERFYRVDKGRSRQLGGTGLGLAIVKNAVLTMGGTIVAETTKGGGLTVRLTLQAANN